MSKTMKEILEERVAGALQVAYEYGSCDGRGHKQWVIDQMVRALAGDNYEEWVKKFNRGIGDEEDEILWDEGRAP